MRLDDLEGRDLKLATSILARPTDGASDVFGDGYTTTSRHTCETGRFCVHWVDTTVDRVDATDENTDGVPDWVEVTAATLNRVWDVEVVELGYRPPRPDAGAPRKGPDRTVDVYLADLGGEGIFGYCASELPSNPVHTTGPGYCVLDNDFSPAQYGAPALESLQVSAAHEFFHAIQFGYDAWEDSWMSEGTAAWVEEQVYDDIDDNRRYLPFSQLTRPRAPLDDSRGLSVYGSWLYWQHLAERHGPGVVRHAWELAADWPDSPDHHSTNAVAAALAGRGASFGGSYAAYGLANLRPADRYEEGAEYRTAPVTGAFTLTATQPRTGKRTVVQDHLTRDAVRFVPHASLTGPRTLALTVDMAPPARGSIAHVQVFKAGGTVEERRVTLNRYGNAATRVPFTVGEVTKVNLVMTNASRRYACWKGTGFACSGAPRDENLTAAYTATAVRR